MQFFFAAPPRPKDRCKALESATSNVKFHQDRTKDKKVMAFDNSGTKAVLSALPGPTPKRCEPQLFLAALGQVVHCWKALDFESLNMQFQHDSPKEITVLFIFLPENLGKFHSTELYDTPLEGSTIFLSQLLRLYIYAKLSIS